MLLWVFHLNLLMIISLRNNCKRLQPRILLILPQKPPHKTQANVSSWSKDSELVAITQGIP